MRSLGAWASPSLTCSLPVRGREGAYRHPTQRAGRNSAFWHLPWCLSIQLQLQGQGQACVGSSFLPFFLPPSQKDCFIPACMPMCLSQFNRLGLIFSLSALYLIHRFLGFSDILRSFAAFLFQHTKSQPWGSQVAGGPFSPGFCPFARAGASPR